MIMKGTTKLRGSIQFGALLLTMVFSGCCTGHNQIEMKAPKAWHHLSQKQELWGKREISCNIYLQCEIGDSAKAVDVNAPQDGVAILFLKNGNPTRRASDLKKE